MATHWNAARLEIMALVCGVVMTGGHSEFLPHARASDGSRGAVVRRLEALQNLTVDYEERTTYRPWPSAKAASRRRVVRNNVVRSRCRLRTHGGRWEFASELIEAIPPGAGEMAKMVFAASEGRFEYLWKEREDVPAHGHINDAGGRTHDEVISLVLGLAMAESPNCLSVDASNRWEFSDSESGTIARCRDEKGRKHEWLFHLDPLKLLRYQVFSKKGWLYIDVEASDFIEVEGLWLPMACKYGHYSEIKGERREVKHRDLVVSSVVVNSPANVSHDFRIQWPLHSVVYDMRTKAPFVVESGVKSVSDEELLDVAKRRPRPVPRIVP